MFFVLKSESIKRCYIIAESSSVVKQENKIELCIQKWTYKLIWFFTHFTVDFKFCMNISGWSNDQKHVVYKILTKHKFCRTGHVVLIYEHINWQWKRVCAVGSVKFIPVWHFTYSQLHSLPRHAQETHVALKAIISMNCDLPPKLSWDITLNILITKSHCHYWYPVTVKKLKQTV